MKFEIADMVAAGAVVLAVAGFAWGIKQNNNYNNEKRVRNDEAVMKTLYENWANFKSGNNTAADVHATVDAIINKHEWYSDVLRDAAHALNTDFLNNNL